MFLQRLDYLIQEKCDGRKIILSKATGIASSIITSYFTRGSSPSASQLIKIADYFGVTIDYLLGREDDFGIIASKTDNDFTYEENRLIQIYRTLSDRDKKMIDGIFNSFVSDVTSTNVKANKF